MLRTRIVVDAMWDAEAGVYVATSQDVPGLVAEAEQWEELQRKLAVLIPELLELNGAEGSAAWNDEADLTVFMETHSTVRLRA